MISPRLLFALCYFHSHLDEGLSSILGMTASRDPGIDSIWHHDVCQDQDEVEPVERTHGGGGADKRDELGHGLESDKVQRADEIGAELDLSWQHASVELHQVLASIVLQVLVEADGQP